MPNHRTTPADTSLRCAENRILVKFKEPCPVDSRNRFIQPPFSNTMYGIGIEKIEPLNPATPQFLADTESPGSQGNQNKWAAVELSESGPDAVCAAVDSFLQSGEYEFVEKDYVVRLGNTSNENPPPMCGGCLYGLRKIGAPQAWEITKGDRNIVVGIIDSGIDLTHPSIKDNIWINPHIGAYGYENDKYGYDFVNGVGIDDTYLSNDTTGHGTHVAGTVGASLTEYCSVVGVSPNVRLAAIKIVEAGNYDYVSTIVKGINYANIKGFPITNNSYGTSAKTMAMLEAVSQAGLFVACAMNDGRNTDEYPEYPGSFTCDNVITVASTDYYDILAETSNYSANLVHLSAPGVNICSAHTQPAPMGYIHGFITMSGTSMASPHVAGAAALILPLIKGYDAQRSEGLNASDRKWIKELRDIILNNVDPVSGLAGKTITGGRLNLYNAIKSIK